MFSEHLGKINLEIESQIFDMSYFCEKFKELQFNTKDLTSIIDYINTECLESPRLRLIPKLNQKMTFMNFIESICINTGKMWCISHKMRSGKSILILLICKYLLKTHQ